MDWGAWAENQKTINGRDPRVQAIRCASCRRLRAHPTRERITCACGGLQFEKTHPHEDEMPLAMKLYAREIDESNILGRIAQQAVAEHERGG